MMDANFEEIAGPVIICCSGNSGNEYSSVTAV